MSAAVHTLLLALSLLVGTSAMSAGAGAQEAAAAGCLAVRIGVVDPPLLAAGIDSARLLGMADARLGRIPTGGAAPACPGPTLVIDARVSQAVAAGEQWVTLSGRLVQQCPPGVRESCGTTWQSSLPSFPLRPARVTRDLLDDRLRSLSDELAEYLAPPRPPASSRPG